MISVEYHGKIGEIVSGWAIIDLLQKRSSKNIWNKGYNNNRGKGSLFF